ncbi:MAG: 2Fe-2S iron-sulfur cluster binding domain-containing protein [Alphaproteobacteria bacterium]|nr:2Fe-2S iron-sulfur cluster binding domain-containing protein [Alphaproteobacteria bacterium]
MPRIIFFQPDGQRREVEAPVGSSVMLAAVQNNVRGIDADCGGCCSCATCHCYVDAAFLERLPAPEDMELEMLGGTAAERRPNSRLGCQIAMTAELDGLVVRLPDRQV